jgi:malonate-semialdehyde dehydrogenase (acetylating)/methylmalonate-semialdehyde dehydrogenase
MDQGLGLNFINGQWTEGLGGRISVHSPQDGVKLGEAQIPSPGQIETAIEQASVAQKSWSQVTHKERAQILFRFREILIRDLEKIATLKSRECGKTLAEARAGLMKGIEVTEYALSIQNLDLGGKMEVSRGVTCEFKREPLGVVASITPFNFPAMVPLWTIPIAISLGNAYVWKPSDKTPLTASYIASALQEAGLPAGIFTVLHGSAETVKHIMQHPLVKAIAFVGSTSVAKSIYQTGTQLGKRVLALGGAKNHIVLLPDANLEMSGRGIADSFTGCAGQRCMAASVLLAVGDVDKHLEQIVSKAKSLELGTSMGAIITKSQLEFLTGAIERAVKNGAKILLDGRTFKSPNQTGNWLGPTILDHVKPGSEAATSELFGPILSIIRCRDIKEAMDIENSVEYGNACSVFTSSGAHADRIIREASAGMVGVNVGVPVPREPFSFGGINVSKFGHGDITGKQSIDFWTNSKKITTKWELQTQSNWMA